MILNQNEVQFLEQFMKTTDGRQFLDILKRTIQELNSISTLGDLKSEKEVTIDKLILGRKIAINILMELFTKMKFLQIPPEKGKGRKSEYK